MKQVKFDSINRMADETLDQNCCQKVFNRGASHYKIYQNSIYL